MFILPSLESGVSNKCSEFCVYVTHLTPEGIQGGLLGVGIEFEDDLVVFLGVLDAMVD